MSVLEGIKFFSIPINGLGEQVNPASLKFYVAVKTECDRGCEGEGFGFLLGSKLLTSKP